MKRILVADDSVTIQKVIALTFADEPFEVQSAGTGAEALEKMKQWRPDIVLADVIMPQMNGYELCRTIKQQDATREIPVLLLAGTFEAFDQGEANSSGANDYITKPFESAELIEKVKALTAGIPPRAAQPGAPSAGTQPAARAQAPSAAPPAPPKAPQPPPPPPPAAPASEPDIWDLLGDTGPEATPGESGTPAFVMNQETGVVDVGSFEVSLDRLEERIPQPPSPRPAAPQKPSAAPAPSTPRGVPQAPQAPMPKPAATPPPAPKPPTPRPPQAAPPSPPAPQAQVPKPAAAPPAAPPPPAPPRPPQAAAPPPPAPRAPQASEVERREKDFFGFDTEAEEGLGEVQVPEGIEELSFDIEEPKAIVEEEVSFIVPEPVEPGPLTTGETISIDLMSMREEASEPAVAELEEPAAFLDELRGLEDSDFKEAELPPLPEAPAVFEETETVIEELQAEPPKISPAPAPPPKPAAAPQPPPAGAAGAAELGGIAMDESMRKLIEEKVEKIVWEVVPEMAEVLIREAIEKIKRGT